MKELIKYLNPGETALKAMRRIGNFYLFTYLFIFILLSNIIYKLCSF